MKVQIIFWRGHYALMTLVGFRPALSPDERIVRMAFEKTQQLIDDATAAFNRIIAAKQAEDTANSDLQNQVNTLTQEVADADAAAAAQVQPLHDLVVGAAPPAPPPAEPAPADPGAPTGTAPAA